MPFTRLRHSLFPYFSRQFTIFSSDTPDVVLERIRSRIVPMGTSPLKAGLATFEGSVGENEYFIAPILRAERLHGRVSSDSATGGSMVNATAWVSPARFAYFHQGVVWVCVLFGLGNGWDHKTQPKTYSVQLAIEALGIATVVFLISLTGIFLWTLYRLPRWQPALANLIASDAALAAVNPKPGDFALTEEDCRGCTMISLVGQRREIGGDSVNFEISFCWLPHKCTFINVASLGNRTEFLNDSACMHHWAR